MQENKQLKKRVQKQNFRKKYMKKSPIQISHNIKCLVAPNPGPFTKDGTNTYLIGQKQIAVIDPGPQNHEHLESILSHTKGQTITHIFVTHTHKDHSPLSRELAMATGAQIVGCTRHTLSQPHMTNLDNPFDAATDHEYHPDLILQENDLISSKEWSISALATPGHTINHMAFVFEAEQMIFTGDHIMGWSSSVIAPPEGHMGMYLNSLEKLTYLPHQTYLSGHGEPIWQGPVRAKQLLDHRMNRHNNLLMAVKEGFSTPQQLLQGIYGEINAKLKRAAELTILAHLEFALEQNEIELNQDEYKYLAK